MVFTTRFAGGRGGRNGFETELARLHITQKNSRPNHPTTCGKVERFHQTLKQWLRARPAANTINELQALLDTFVERYNHHRPHRSLPHRPPPPSSTTPDPKPPPPASPTRTTVSATTASTTPAPSPCASTAASTTSASAAPTPEPTSIVLADDLHSGAVDASTGELLRDLTIDPTHDYQPTGAPKGPTRPKTNGPNPMRVRTVSDVSRHHNAPSAGFEPATHGLGNRCSIP